jgi:hypothetical protein
MGALFGWIWDSLKALAGLFLPVASGVRRFSSPALRWSLRVVVIGLLWAALYFLNRYLGVERLVLVRFRAVADQYLPVLVLLILTWVWLGWYLWKLLTEQESSDFPDIDAAWREAMAALTEEGIDLVKVPIFLVLGRSLGGESALFHAAVVAGRSLRVKGVPAHGPLRAYASDQAVYITCAGASVLGHHAALLTQMPTPPPARAGEKRAEPDGQDSSDSPIFRSIGEPIFRSIGAENEEQRQIAALLAEAARQKRNLTEEEKKKLEELLRRGGMSSAGAAPAPGAFLPSEEAALEEDAARLEHLCRLISRQRRPSLPVKGILVLVPWGGAASEEAATATANACRRDLSAARTALRVDCPVIAMVADLETAPGFPEFAKHFSQKDREMTRIGRSFPLTPDLNGRRLADVVHSALAWFCTTEFPTWIYKFFDLESSDGERPEAATQANVQLYQILAQLLERHQRISHILTQGITDETAGGRPMFGGCYLAGTGSKPEHNQAFVAAVFHRLVEERKNASWSEAALAADVRQRRWGTWGLAVVAALLVLLAVLIYIISQTVWS